MRKDLTDYLATNDNNTAPPPTLWEGATGVMRANIMAISSRLKKQRLAQRVELEGELRD